jgi:lysozyme
MLSNQEIAQYVQGHEGLSLKPYICTAGKVSIGIGRNLDDRGISQDEALYLFNNDCIMTDQDLHRVFGSDFDRFPDNARLVFFDMMFQLGLVRFCGFRKMIEKAKAEDWKGAAEELMDSRYAKQVPKRAEENRDKLLQI